MDTRHKIIDAAEAAALAQAGATVVRGYFDPLIAEHAERLTEFKRAGAPLLVLIATPPNPILPDRARAELVAALAVVDRVALTGDAAPGASITPQIRLEEEDLARQARLIEHVHSRQGAR